MLASNTSLSLAIISVPLYRLWQATGFTLLLGVVVAGWLAVFVDLLWAYFGMRSPRLLVSTPLVVFADEPFRVRVEKASPAGAMLTLFGTSQQVNERRVLIGSGIDPLMRLDRRAMHGGLYGEVTAHGPLGLIACRRRFVVPIGGGLAVGPVPVDDVPLDTSIADDDSLEMRNVGRGADLTRSVRAYRRGDEQKNVAWKASARVGELMVRELEGTVDTEITIAVNLPKPGESATEVAAVRAASFAMAALRMGHQVRLITNHDDDSSLGRTARGKNVPLPPSIFGKPTLTYPASRASHVMNALVTNETELTRRLAAATKGDDLAKVAGSRALLVSASGDRWLP